MRVRHFLHPEAILLHDVIATEYWPDSLVPDGLGALGRVLRAREDGAKFAAFLFEVARASGAIMPERADFAGWRMHTVLLASDDVALRRAAWQEIDRAERARAREDDSTQRFSYRRALRA